jgi:hypothetical protein
MSSLTLSILILAVLVALGVGAHSFWVLRRENKKIVQLSPKESETQVSPGKSSAFGMTQDKSTKENSAEPQNAPSASIGAGAAFTVSDTSDALAEALHSSNREPEHDQPLANSSEATRESALAPSRQPTASPGLSQDPQGDLLAAHEQGAIPLSEGRAEDLEAKSQTLDSTGQASASVDRKPNELEGPKLEQEAIPSGSRVLHDDADCLIPIALPQPSSGDRLIGLTKSIRRAGGKPVAFEGCSNGTWEGLRYGASYQSLRAGILLSNRQGPLNAMEFSELSSKLLGLGAQLGVPIEMPEMNSILQRARSLDSMLAECDVQLGLAVDCSRALSTTDLATLARRIGLHERGNNRYALLSEQAEVIYSVALGDKAQRLQLMFDVPRVLPEHKPWWKMAEAANQASILFDGKITDDSGRELSEQSFKHVAIALEGRQQALAEAGVPAGSVLALRVFN